MFTEKRRILKPKPVPSISKTHANIEMEDEALHLIEALLRSPHPAENDEISEFYSEVRQQNEQGVESASEWFDRITSSNK
ncbi:hypothetical protein ACKGJO_00670 [Gracilimonas sp. Q87]|uniref:hypothetical protein n=1 Tax=Gracilimonas sp. Q87 TaxID=3384766 RepID=UPI0039842767